MESLQDKNTLKFSVLMSVYYKDKASYLDESLNSIWNQSLQPNEILIVQDGRISKDLYRCLETWKNNLGNKLKLIKLPENRGLAFALNYGLKFCSYELVARMDSDDISDYRRFEKQIDVFKTLDIDVCGSWVAEFEKSLRNIEAIRKVPETHEEIKAFARKRSPLNHPTVMFKKEKVLKVGGYPQLKKGQDYALWVSMLSKGYKFYNIQEPLVYMRVSDDFYKRRGGFSYIKYDFELIKYIYELGFIDKKDFFLNLITRIPIRLFPSKVLRMVYSFIRKL
ncbi:glycosyltransferase [Persephonella sp.]